MSARLFYYRLRNRTRDFARSVIRNEFLRLKLGLAKVFRKPPPPDPFSYDEELVPVGHGPHLSGAVALEEPKPYRRTDARAR
jgi:hypothetical protein